VLERDSAIVEAGGTGVGIAGTFAGSIDGIPGFDVGVPVTGRPFWIFEFDESGLVNQPEEAVRA
jgi:hypothetical protein